MFRYHIHALALRRLGLTRPIRLILLIVFLGCFIVGLIYAAIVFNALNERSRDHHVISHIAN